MDLKERVMIYPYSIQFSPVLRHNSLLSKYHITGLVSPNGWGFTGKDACAADMGNAIEIQVTANFEETLSRCDTVIFIESYFYLDFEKIVLPKIKIAISAGKNIIYTSRLDKETQFMLEGLCGENEVYFKYLGENKLGILDEYYIVNESIEEIDTPVIFVLGIAERTNKFEIQLALREQILKMGYRISQIGTRSYCELLDFHSFPGFMYDSNISEAKKVVLFNRFVQKIEEAESPDVIIIGIPGGIMPFNKRFTNGFGILAYEVAQAITPDATVFSLLYEDYKSEGFIKYSKSIKYKLGFNIDCINIANAQFDWAKAEEERLISYITIESDFIDNKIRSLTDTHVPVYNILNKEDSAKLVNNLIDNLAHYGNADVV